MGRKKKINKEKQLMLPELVEKQLIAFSADFMFKYLTEECFSKWTLLHRKLFALFLNEVDWKGVNPLYIELDNKHIADELGWDFTNSGDRAIGAFLRDSFKHMAENSIINLYSPTEKDWLVEPLIIHASGNAIRTTVALNPHFMPHFEKLYEYVEIEKKGFFTLLVPDILGAKTEAGINLLNKLRFYHKKNGCGTYTHIFRTKELKDIFRLKKGDYMRKKISENEYKDFNRTGFERDVLIKALEDVNLSEMVRIVPAENNALYEKVKEGKKVIGYRITWRVYDDETIKKIRSKNIEYAMSQHFEIPNNIPDPYSDVIELDDDYSVLF